MSKSLEKSVLIVSYYWPPSAGSGVQRWLKLSKYFETYGWKAIIYTPENPDFDLKDQSLLKDVSPNIEILKNKIYEPYSIAKLFSGKKKLNTGLVDKKDKQRGLSKIMNWVRGNWFIPDPRVVWVKPSIRFLNAHLRKHEINAIITTGPPHSMHMIGRGIKKANPNIPWIVDIRDPWSKLDFLDTFNLTTNSRNKYARLEKNILSECDQVVATSYSMPEMLEVFDQSKFQCITNGYDQDDFKSFTSKPNNKEYVIYHAGLLNQLRNPVYLWQAIENYCLANPEKNIVLHLCGTIDPQIIEALKKRSITLKIEAYKAHDEIIKDYESADALLLLVNQSQNSKVNIPGKLFEYLATGKNIIGIGNESDDAIKILRERKFICFNYMEEIDNRDIASIIRHDVQSSNADQFSRRSTAKSYCKLLDRLSE